MHDICSAIHPLGVASPFFRALPLARYGLDWIYPPAAVAHPLDDGSAVLAGSLSATAAQLGQDAGAYRRLMGPLTAGWQGLLKEILGPLRIPRHPLTTVRFGLAALPPAATIARLVLRGARARALFAGAAAHSMMPLSWPATSAFGLTLLLLAHAWGWPVARGGSQRISDALVAHLRALGGEVRTSAAVTDLGELPEAAAILLDLAPRAIVEVAGERLPPGYRRKLADYRYGPGVFKIDWALDDPVPWRAKECLQAGTVHVGGTLEEIAAAEAAVWRGECSEHPFVLLAQQSRFDPARAPAGKHTLWGYCHVPSDSTADMTERIEAQIERFAPGFRDRILARSTRNAVEMAAYNPNYVGGDINTGVQDLLQLCTRPVARLDPYATPAPGIFICSSATPPGGGVHGMCGYHAARSALRAVG